jgi:hypothetical protein
MDRKPREGLDDGDGSLDNLDDSFEASDLSTVPEGVQGYVDLIGDENLDGWRTGEPNVAGND